MDHCEQNNECTVTNSIYSECSAS